MIMLLLFFVADMWGLGVITYLLVSGGVSPFWYRIVQVVLIKRKREKIYFHKRMSDISFQNCAQINQRVGKNESWFLIG